MEKEQQKVISNIMWGILDAFEFINDFPNLREDDLEHKVKYIRRELEEFDKFWNKW